MSSKPTRQRNDVNSIQLPLQNRANKHVGVYSRRMWDSGIVYRMIGDVTGGRTEPAMDGSRMLENRYTKYVLVSSEGSSARRGANVTYRRVERLARDSIMRYKYRRVVCTDVRRASAITYLLEVELLSGLPVGTYLVN